MKATKAATAIGFLVATFGIPFTAYGKPIATPLIPCATSDISFGSSVADQCFGPIDVPTHGNDSASVVSAYFDASFDFLLKDDVGTSGDGVGRYHDVSFALSSVSGTYGAWTLGWTDNNTNKLPMNLDLAVIIKAGDYYDGYLFKDLSFADSPASSSGMWNISFLNNGGEVPNLSHFSLYVHDNGLVNPNGGLVNGSIPEPQPLALVGLGLLVMGGVKRRGMF